MNFKNVETLVHQCKKGDEVSKAHLAEEFKPLILNLSIKYKIQGYDFQDLISECYKALFTSLDKYHTDKHRFVSFATISIQNHLKTLLRNVTKRKHLEGQEILTITDQLEHVLLNDENIEESVCEDDFKSFLTKCFRGLSADERDFVNFVYFENKSVRAFALKNKINYTQAIKQNKIILTKLKLLIEIS